MKFWNHSSCLFLGLVCVLALVSLTGLAGSRPAIDCGIALVVKLRRLSHEFEDDVPRQIPRHLLPYLWEIREQVLANGFDKLTVAQHRQLCFLTQRLFLLLRRPDAIALESFFFHGEGDRPASRVSFQLAGLWRHMKDNGVPYFLRFLPALSELDRDYFVRRLYNRQDPSAVLPDADRNHTYFVLNRLLKAAAAYGNDETGEFPQRDALLENLKELRDTRFGRQSTLIFSLEEIEKRARRWHPQQEETK